MLLTTTSTIEGNQIQYSGVVRGEAFAGVRDIGGGCPAAYEGELRKAKEIAMREMEQQAVVIESSTYDMIVRQTRAKPQSHTHQ